MRVTKRKKEDPHLAKTAGTTAPTKSIARRPKRSKD